MKEVVTEIPILKLTLPYFMKGVVTEIRFLLEETTPCYEGSYDRKFPSKVDLTIFYERR